MQKLTFLGLGAMGRRMAARLLSAGYSVTVWNRDSRSTIPLVELGAGVASTPAEAAAGADIVLSMVRDDVAAASIWLDAESGALAGMQAGAVAVECSTVSVDHVCRMADACGKAGVAFLDAPLAGSRPQAEAGQLIFMAGGDEAVLSSVAPVLAVLGSKTLHAGGTGAGAAAKLLVNGMFALQVAGVAELLTLLKNTGQNPAQMLEILAGTPVCSPALSVAAQAMLAGQWQPMFPIDLVAKDLGLICRALPDAMAELPVMHAVHDVFDGAARQGFGQDNITGVIQAYQPG